MDNLVDKPKIELIAEIERLKKLLKPTHFYDPNSWEYSYMVEDRDLVIDKHDYPGPGEVQEFGTLIDGPPIYAANVILAVDDCGDPDKTEIKWFDSKEEAHAAAEKRPAWNKEKDNSGSPS